MSVPTPPQERIDGEGIYRRLRAEILAGTHQPGTPMREVGLAERFGVSRTPVREALGRLQHERLLERAARGLQVPAVDPQEVIQVYDMRVLLEAEAAGQAAQSRNEADLMHLKGLLDRDRRLQSPDDAERTAANLEFHAAVWTAAHNRVLQDLLERLSTHLVHAPRSTLSVGDRWEKSLDEHEALIAAIEARDAGTAQSLARQHMETARRLRLELLRSAATRPGR